MGQKASCSTVKKKTSGNINPLTTTVDMGTAIKHLLRDWVKPSFVIFDIWAL